MSSAAQAFARTKRRSQAEIDVLVVESNPADTRLTIEAFKSVGLTNGPRSVREGEDALQYVLRKGSYKDAPIPDLIFVDLSQPKSSALEFLKVAKATPALKHIPIVVAAGSEDPRFVKSVYALKGTCFIRKPTDLVEFVRLIQTCYEFWNCIVTGSRSCLDPTHLRLK